MAELTITSYVFIKIGVIAELNTIDTWKELMLVMMYQTQLIKEKTFIIPVYIKIKLNLK